MKRINWDEYAQDYDVLLKLTPYHNTLTRVAQDVISCGSQKILDAACGTGNFMQLLSNSDPQRAHICGIDFSSEMLGIAKKKNDERLSTLIYSDINEPLPFTSGTFDTIVSINTLYATHSPTDILEEFARVLKASGHLFLVTPKFGYENGLILKEHCHSTKPDAFWSNAHSSAEREDFLIRQSIEDTHMVSRLLRVSAHNRYIASDSMFHFFELEKLKTLVTSCGFSIELSTHVSANQDIYIHARRS